MSFHSINMHYIAFCSRLNIIAILILLIFGQVQSKSINYKCDLSKYRLGDGFCNNVQHVDWGAINGTYTRLLPSANDDFLKSLPPVEIVAVEILQNVKNMHSQDLISRTGIFQMWTEMLMLDLDLPLKTNQTRNLATAYLDASFLYSSINCTVKTENGDLLFHSSQNYMNISAYAKAAIFLLISEHNRVVNLLRQKNVRWDVETIFEESKRVIVAEIQHITYTQYLPLLLGLLNTRTEEDERLKMWSLNISYNENIETGIHYSMSKVVFNILRSNNNEDNDYSNEDWMNLLKSYLISLAFNIHDNLNQNFITKILQFSRDHKLSSYEQWKHFCDITTEIDMLFSSHSNKNQNNIKLIYNKFNEIELLMGSILETNIPNGLFGPTLSCIIANQFQNIQQGDRFWYTHTDYYDSSFTTVQLKELQRITISDLLCSNVNNLKTIQENAFIIFDSKSNPSVLCSMKTSFSLSSWADNSNVKYLMKEKIIKDAIRKAELDISRRRQTEYLLWSNKEGVDPKSSLGTAAAFSKPTINALLLANNSLLLEYASYEILNFLNRRFVSRRRKRQFIDTDDSIISLTDDLGGNFLQDIDVSNILPSITDDPSNTCPNEISACDPSYPYRSFTGYCNNLRKPNYGKSLSTFSRILPPAYENGISKPRLHSVMGIPLPSARLVSSMMHLDISHLSTKHSMMLMQFAQFLDHDITFTPIHRGFFASIPDCRPCDSPHTVHPECMPIEVPTGDPYYPQVNYTTGKRFCLPFMRSLPGQQRLGSREQINQNSAFLDASQVYGDNACLARELRNYYQGHLNTTISLYGDKDLLPQSPKHPECRASSGYCFIAGDGRASEQPGLTSIHTIFMREHNRLADGLRMVNPRWEDERLYQTARKILIGKYQHIIYNEFLPRILGHTAMNLYDLNLEAPNLYFKEYSEECNPGIFSEFAAAAFRIGHSLLRPFIPRLSPGEHILEPAVLLRDTFFNPDLIYQRHMIDEMIRGLYSTPVETLDQFITKEITNHLFEDKRIPHSGIDLPALNVQRARDHGIPSYNDYRTMCNLKRATIWDDFSRELPNDVIIRLKRIYATVDDVDLFPAGISERPISGGMVGPTFACIIGLQFRQLRYCDRFWYETPYPILKFTTEQLAEIRKATLSKILCDNMDIPTPIQRHAMDMPSEENEKIPCHALPQVNLKAWKDGDQICQFRGIAMGVGESHLPTPCTSCICTPQGMKCATIRVTNCFKLMQEVGEAAVLKDEVCAAQCGSYVNVKNSDTPFPLSFTQSRGINFYFASGLRPPLLPITPRRKNPSTRSFKIRDFSIVIG